MYKVCGVQSFRSRVGKNILELYTGLFGHKAVITVLALSWDLGSTSWGLLSCLLPAGSVCVLSASQSTRPSTGAHRSQRNDEGDSKTLIRKRPYLHYFVSATLSSPFYGCWYQRAKRITGLSRKLQTQSWVQVSLIQKPEPWTTSEMPPRFHLGMKMLGPGGSRAHWGNRRHSMIQINGG